MTPRSAIVWLLLCCASVAACSKRATLLGTIAGSAPSFTGLVVTPHGAVSVSEIGQVRGIVGTELGWSVSVSGPVRQRPALLDDGEVLVVANQTGDLYGVATADGKVVFHLLAQQPPVLPLASNRSMVVVASATQLRGHGSGGAARWKVDGGPFSALAMTDFLVLAASAETLTAFDAQSGEKRWSIPGRVAGLAATGDHILVHFDNGAVASLDIAIGTPKWKVDLGEAAPGTLGVDGETLWVGLQRKEAVQLAIDDGRELMRVKVRAPPVAPPTLTPTRVLVPLSGADGCVASVLREGLVTQGELCADHQLKGPVVAVGETMLSAPRDGRILVFALPPLPEKK